MQPPNFEIAVVTRLQALRRSRGANSDQQDLRNIYESTFAIMFFGTPHRGSDYAVLSQFARNIAVASGFDANDRILRDLKPDSQHASLLREEFSQILAENRVFIDTFQEAKGFHGVKGLTGKVFCHLDITQDKC
jgi:hypothetical protein